jgi:hypothetical protein
MGETISQIERDLEAERNQLNRNLNELETKAKQMTDWKHYYRNHPGQLIGAALATGVVLGIIAGGRSSSSSSQDSHHLTSTPDNGAPRPRHRALARIESDWQHISDALMGVASAKVMEFVGNLVPGFNDHIKRDSRSM